MYEVPFQRIKGLFEVQVRVIQVFVLFLFFFYFLLNQRLAVYIHEWVYIFYKTLLCFTYHVAVVDFDPVCYAGGSYFVVDVE